ncbi:MAG: 2Fe-2S iron-sulfur cluster-binding protein [Negativicutes bacterium]|nr:2Fe-2S iron-sulfur cluster-binding protein [Negativicutes bacterium]
MKDLLIKVKVRRFDQDQGYFWQSYNVDTGDEAATVLGVLQIIYAEQDPGLSFSYGCRYKRCGLCGMIINGVPGMACLVPAGAELTIEPLKNLPPVKDLVVDRASIQRLYAKHRLYTPGHPYTGFPEVRVPDNYKLLSRCIECLCCLSYCRQMESDKNFGGPFLFVKLGQFYNNPKDDSLARKTQARELGLDVCQDCRSCRCPNGIPIYRAAIEPMLSANNDL